MVLFLMIFIFNRIKDLKKKDDEKLLLAKATNDLESFIIDTQDKLYQEDYEKCSTEDERTEIQSNLSAASDWLYEQDETVERKVNCTYNYVEKNLFCKDTNLAVEIGHKRKVGVQSRNEINLNLE